MNAPEFNDHFVILGLFFIKDKLFFFSFNTNFLCIFDYFFRIDSEKRKYSVKGWTYFKVLTYISK